MIQSIHRALNILELLSAKPDRIFSLNEIAGEFDLNLATCANIIKTLVDRSYIEQIGSRKGYRLGPILYYLTSHSSYEKTLIEKAAPLIQDLASKLNEAVAISVLRNFQRFVLIKAIGDQEIQVNLDYKKDVYQTNTGRLMLSFLEKEQLKSFVKKHGLPKQDSWENFPDLKVFERKLNSIRKKGIIVHQDKASHLASVAVPVMKNNKCLAALGVYLPLFRFTKEKKEQIISDLTDLASKL
jgi:IclR family transcriptional regulator, KDG regulon repressor